MEIASRIMLPGQLDPGPSSRPFNPGSGNARKCLKCNAALMEIEAVPKPSASTPNLCMSCVPKHRERLIRPKRRDHEKMLIQTQVRHQTSQPPEPATATILTPMPTSLPHFTSRGEYIALPDQKTLSTQIPHINIRVCMRFGCGAILPPRYPASICQRCMSTGQVHMSLASSSQKVLLPSKRKPSHSPQSTHMPIRSSSTTNIQNDPADLTLELTYPDLEMHSTQFIPPSPILTFYQSPPIASPTTTYNGQPQSESLPSHLHDSLSKQTRACESEGCEGTIASESRSKFCLACTLKNWEGRANRVRSRSRVDGGYPEDGRQLAQDKGKWKAIDDSVGDAVITESGKEKGVVIPLATLSVSPLRAADHKDVPLSEPNASLALSNAGVSGWDSDLTDLSDLSDLGESEIDDMGSEEETDATPISSGFKIRIPARTTTSAPRICVLKHCINPLPDRYRWKLCPPCRTHHREYQRKRLGIIGHKSESPERPPDSFSSPSIPGVPAIPVVPAVPFVPVAPPFPGFIPDPARHYASPSKLIFDPIRDPSLFVVGAQVCTIRNCKHVLPPVIEYRWKMCAPCRARTRENARRRRQKKKLGGGIDPSEAAQSRDGEGSLSPESEDDPEPPPEEQKTTVTTKRKSLRCNNYDCGMLLKVDSSSSECQQCLLRNERTRERQAGIKGYRQRAASFTLAPAKIAEIPAYVARPQNRTPYPAYQHFPPLLQDFKALLRNFLEAQSHYLLFRLKGHVTIPAAPAVFGFDGEFSTVAIDFNLQARQVEIREHVNKTKDEIEKAVGMKFHTTSWVSYSNTGGIITRFTCKQDVSIFKSPSLTDPASGQDMPISPKHMTGELEVAVLPDRSHPCLPGQRTVVRFRLVG